MYPKSRDVITGSPARAEFGSLAGRLGKSPSSMAAKRGTKPLESKGGKRLKLDLQLQDDAMSKLNIAFADPMQIPDIPLAKEMKLLLLRGFLHKFIMVVQGTTAENKFCSLDGVESVISSLDDDTISVAFRGFADNDWKWVLGISASSPFLCMQLYTH